MLKVIGASWVQTKTSWWILKGIILLGMLTIYFGIMPRREDDGKYAATVFWFEETKEYDIQFWGQNNDPVNIKLGAARAYYQPDMLRTGWATLEIETNERYPDYVQAFSSGMLEGSLSWLHIYWQWKNTIEKTCIDRIAFCKYVREYLANNTSVIRSKSIFFDVIDPFWHQVNLFYIQLDGLEYGWKFEVARNREHYEIPPVDFLWMNIMSDMKDFEEKLNPSGIPSPSVPIALLKLIPDLKENRFILAHASSGIYSSMLRIRKKYKFGYHETSSSSSHLVSGGNIQFTSYPASIHSQDDFYQIIISTDEKVTITGSAIHNYNHTDWRLIDAQKQVLMGMRVMASNRLSVNGKSWSSIMQKYNSGTGNKQWLHVHTRGKKNLTLWVTEQMPGMIESNDETEALYKRGYWISYGIPHYRDIPSNILDDGNADVKYSFALLHLPILKVLRSGQSNVTDLISLLNLMRGPDLTIVGRSDLYEDGLPVAPQIHFWTNFVRRYKLLNSFKQQHKKIDTFYYSDLKISSSSKNVSTGLSNNNNNNNSSPSIQNVKAYNEILNNSSLVNKNQERPSHKLINVEYSAPKNSFLRYNTTVIKLFTLKSVIFLYNPSTSNMPHSAEDDSENNNETVVSEKSYPRNSMPTFAKSSKNQIGNVDIDGVIDLKITIDNSDFIAVAGPPFTMKNNLHLMIAPFQWSKSRIKNLPHNGHADVWNYMPVTTNWVWA